MTIDNAAIREALIRIGDEQELGAIACIVVDETGVDIHFMQNSKCPYLLQALRALAAELRELAERVDYAVEGVLADKVAAPFVRVPESEN